MPKPYTLKRRVIVIKPKEVIKKVIKKVLNKDVLNKDVIDKSVVNTNAPKKKVIKKAVIIKKVVLNERIIQKGATHRNTWNKNAWNKNVPNKSVVNNNVIKKDVLHKDVVQKGLVNRNVLNRGVLKKGIVKKVKERKRLVLRVLRKKKRPVTKSRRRRWVPYKNFYLDKPLKRRERNARTYLTFTRTYSNIFLTAINKRGGVVVRHSTGTCNLHTKKKKRSWDALTIVARRIGKSLIAKI